MSTIRLHISVIIPVYNAERFIEDAVASALIQPEVSEVILVDDGSTDDSLALCRRLEEDARVRTQTHPGKINKGAAETRNVGVEAARMPFIAFLDADDIYLPGRFHRTQELFAAHPDADGIYETIGTQYHDPSLRDKHLERIRSGNTGISIQCPPDQLFRTLATGKYGHIHLNGLTLRKEIFTKVNGFDPAFIMSEDMDLVLRLSAYGKLYGGDPSHLVALRGVHPDNSVFHNPQMRAYRRQYLQKCVRHDFYHTQDLKGALYCISRAVGAADWYQPFRKFGRAALPIKLLGVAGYLFLHPRALFLCLGMVFR